MMEIQLIKAVVKAVAALPMKRALALGRFLGKIYGGVIRYHRKDAEEALARSMPELSAEERVAVIDRMYGNLGLNIVELMRLAAKRDCNLDGRVEPRNLHYVDDALKRGKGVLILTAHLGNWDMLCAYTTAVLGYKLTAITKELRNKELFKFWCETREMYGMHLLPARNSYRQCREVLKRNELLGFILDQNMIRDEGVFVDFFGRPACTTHGLAIMAAQSGAPVVPVFTHRIADDRHVLEVLPPIEPPATARDPEVIRAATQEYTKVIEEAVRRYPDQWIWIHRRWKTQP